MGLEVYRESSEADTVNNTRLAYRIRPDELLWSVFAKNVLSAVPRNFRFCDMGGMETWSLRILREYPNARGLALRPSTEILSRASPNGIDCEERLQFAPVEGHDIASVSSELFQVTLCCYEVDGAPAQPAVLLREAVRITKPGGFLVSLFPSLRDAVLFPPHPRVAKCESAVSEDGEGVSDMSERNLYTPQSIEKLMKLAGAQTLMTFGFPTTVYPWNEEASADSDLLKVLSPRASRTEAPTPGGFSLRPSSRAPRGSELLSIAVVPEPPQRWGEFWLPE